MHDRLGVGHCMGCDGNNLGGLIGRKCGRIGKRNKI